MTVYELIQQLSKYAPDEPIAVARSGSARGLRILSVFRPITRFNDPAAPVVILLDWEKKPPTDGVPDES